MWLSPQPETPVWDRLALNEAPGEAPNEAPGEAPNEAPNEVSDEPRAWPHNAAAAGVSAGGPSIVLAERRAAGQSCLSAPERRGSGSGQVQRALGGTVHMLRPILVRSGARCRLMAPCLSGSFGRKKASPQGSGRFVRVNTCGVSSYGAKLTVRRLRGAAQGWGRGL